MHDADIIIKRADAEFLKGQTNLWIEEKDDGQAQIRIYKLFATDP